MSLLLARFNGVDAGMARSPFSVKRVISAVGEGSIAIGMVHESWPKAPEDEGGGRPQALQRRAVV
jgi:hypothetical protein